MPWTRERRPPGSRQTTGSRGAFLSTFPCLHVQDVWHDSGIAEIVLWLDGVIPPYSPTPNGTVLVLVHLQTFHARSLYTWYTILIYWLFMYMYMYGTGTS